jgi:hypothetical protein
MKRFLIIVIQLLLPIMVLAETKDLPCGISVDFSYNRVVPLGSNLVWTVTLVNRTNTTRTCRLTIGADALQYNGHHIGRLVAQITTNTLAPNATKVVNVTITPVTYTKWTGITSTFELNAFLKVVEQGDIWISRGRTSLITPTDIITVTPTSPILQGQSLTATVKYLNPMPTSLHNVNIYLVASGLSTNSSLERSSWGMGTIGPNEWITVSKNYVAERAGTDNTITALITANELKAVEGWIRVPVIAPQQSLEARVTLTNRVVSK